MRRKRDEMSAAETSPMDTSPGVPLEAELIALSIVPHLVVDGGCPTVAAEAPVAAAAVALAEGGADAVAVVDGDGGYLGLLGLREVAHAVATATLDAPARTAMQPRRDWLAPDDTPLDALELLRARGVEHLPVLDGQRLVGIVSLGQLVRLLHRQFEAQALQRQQRLFGDLPRDG